MNKEEILAKARAEKKDEGETFIFNRALFWTYLAMVLAAAVFCAVRVFRDQSISDLLAVIDISVCVGQFYRYVKTKEKFYLVVSILMIVIGIGFAVSFFMGR